MTIEILLKRFVINGEPMVEIKKLKALRKEQLPKLYFEDVIFNWKNFPITCYLAKLREETASALIRKYHPNSDVLIINKPTNQNFQKITIKEEEILRKETFEYYLSLIHKAGKHLMKINKKLRKESKGWSGRWRIRI